MNNLSIYAPRTLIESVSRWGNKSLIVRIPYQGYELSVYLETRSDQGEFCYGELEVIETATQKNVTKEISMTFGLGEMLDATGENLKLVMHWIDLKLKPVKTDEVELPIDLIEPEEDNGLQSNRVTTARLSHSYWPHA